MRVEPVFVRRSSNYYYEVHAGHGAEYRDGGESGLWIISGYFKLQRFNSPRTQFRKGQTPK